MWKGVVVVLMLRILAWSDAQDFFRSMYVLISIIDDVIALLLW